jgi:hypothetical protein
MSFLKFIDSIKIYFFQKNFKMIESLRENCGGYGFSQYSGIPQIQENAIMNASLLSDNSEYLCDFILLFLGKKFINPENVFFLSLYSNLNFFYHCSD